MITPSYVLYVMACLKKQKTELVKTTTAGGECYASREVGGLQKHQDVGLCFFVVLLCLHSSSGGMLVS